MTTFTRWGEDVNGDLENLLTFLTSANITFEMPEPHEVEIKQDGKTILFTFNGDNSHRRIDVF